MIYDIIAWGIATVMMLVCVLVHYEVIRIVSDIVVPWGLRKGQGRRTMVLSLMTLMFGHIGEIWLFALTLKALAHLSWFGGLGGAFTGDFHDYLYFSAVNYTSLGYGDIHPSGSMRAIAVTEALTGLTMIGWSASFTYLKMEQLWQIRIRRKMADHPPPAD